jgi:hypothetical protein
MITVNPESSDASGRAHRGVAAEPIGSGSVDTARAAIEQLREKYRSELHRLIAQANGVDAAIKRITAKLEAIDEALGASPRIARRGRPRKVAR